MNTTIRAVGNRGWGAIAPLPPVLNLSQPWRADYLHHNTTRPLPRIFRPSYSPDSTTIRIVTSQAQNAYFLLHTVCEDTKRQDM